MKLNRKKLNNKGFTLVELLAVIVILALVMGIAASYMFSTMNQSRSATLHSAAQNTAATLNAWVADDLLVTNDAQMQLGSTFKSTFGPSSSTTGWVCITEGHTINAKGNSVSLLEALGLNKNDVQIGGIDPNGSPNDETCSAIRYNTVTSGYEVLLVAEENGKYFNNSTVGKNFAYSRASGPGEVLGTTATSSDN